MRSLVGLLCLAFAASPAAQLRVYYDRFKDRTEVTANKPASLDRQVMFIGMYPGKDLRAPPATVQIVFMSVSAHWQYLQCGILYLLADGRPTEPAKANHRGKVMDSGSVLEQVTAILPWREAVQLARSEKVETKLCQAEYALDATDTANLRDVIRALTPKP